jgi:acyl-[acyl-carrier-protein]-phospholipid O-acyltransferase / long-chain-fatty-acid--[acyl-carrier-protein] ligase
MKNWTPLFITQFLGILNDNLLKHLIIFISILWISSELQDVIIPIATALLVLPYILFSPFAGFLSQIKTKRTIVRIAKLAEIPIMIIAAFAFSIENISLLLLCLFLMGFQSAIYSPAKLGLIKDISHGSNVSKGTGIMEFFGFLAILFSTVLAGFIANLSSNQNSTIAFTLISIAFIGWLASLLIQSKKHKERRQKSNLSILPLKFLKSSYRKSKKNKGLNSVILGLGMFWMIASLLQMNLLVYCNAYLNLNTLETSVVWAIVIVGIALGCILAGVINKQRVELGISVLGTIGLAIFTSLIAFSEPSIKTFCVYLFFGAMSAGVFKVPLNSWMQERCSSRDLSNRLAYLNMIIFIIVLLSSVIFALLTFNSDSIGIFKFIAYTSILLALIMTLKNPSELIRIIVFFVARTCYKMNIKGIHNIPKKSGALIVANHLSFMDFILIVGAVPRQVRYVMFKGIYDIKWLKWLFKSLNMIPISPRSKNNLSTFNQLCQDQINKGHIVVIFAEGMITRNGHIHEFKKGLEHIAKGINAPIIPIHMDGVLGTPFTYLSGKSSAEKFTFKNLRKKVFINVGAPMASSSSAFNVRQTVTKLQAESVANRIDDQELAHHEFIKYSLKNLKNIAFENALMPVTHKSLLQQVFRRANGIKNVLHDKAYGILFISDEYEHAITTLAMSVAGKTSILAEKSGKNISTLRKTYKCNTVLTDQPIGNVDFEPIWLSHLDQRKFSLMKIRFLKLTRTIDYFFNNKHDKYDDLMIGSTSNLHTALTHQNIISTIYGLQQVNNLKKYGNTKAFFERNSTIHNLLNVWLPASKAIIGMPNTNLKGLNTIIGKEDDLHQIIGSPEVNDLKYIITDYQRNSILTDVIDTEVTTIQRGFGLLESIPILSLNTNDFNGKDIAGKPLFQAGTNLKTAGRPIPGIAVQIVDPSNWTKLLNSNEVGAILVKGAQIAQHLTIKSAEWINGWFNTNMSGYLDENGFMHIVKASDETK